MQTEEQPGADEHLAVDDALEPRARRLLDMRPGSAGSRPRASAGSVSVPRSIARICITVSGRGISAAREREDEERHDLAVSRGRRCRR